MLCAALVMAQTPQTSVEADCGDLVTIKATPATGYHFVQWSDGDTHATRQVSVSGDITYKAYFAINSYTITFLNWNDTVLQTGTYNHGSTVTPPTATKTADAQYTYTFDHWDPTVSYTAVGDATYTAVFSKKTNQYTITFLNWDNSVLESKAWDYGSTPSYDKTPTRPSDEEHDYTFTGWSPAISTVTQDATYTAIYNGSTVSYTLTLDGDHGTTKGGGTYLYGSTPQIIAIPDDCYHFVKWSNGDTNATTTVKITGPTTMTATFEINTYTVKVVSDDETQGSVSISK